MEIKTQITKLKEKVKNLDLKEIHKFIKSRQFKFLLILLILLLGGFMRFYDLNWDQFHFYHPDEITVANMVNKISIPDQLDPNFYSYNGLAPYIDRAAVQITSSLTNDASWKTDISKILLVSRFMSALLSTASILLVYILAKILKGYKVAALSAFFMATSVIFIQHAHFVVTETTMIFFMLLMMIFTTKAFQTHRAKYWFLSAVFSGLAIGTKLTAVFFMVVPFSALGLLFLSDFKNTQKKIKPLFNLISKYGLKAFYFVSAVFTFTFLSTPYSFFRWDEFYKSITYENGMVSGTMPVPYTVQYFDTPKYFYHLYNMLWSSNWIVPVAGIAGIFLWIYLIFKKKENWFSLPLLIFAISFFFYIGGEFTKFMRYMMPIIPVLIISASFFTIRSAKYLKNIKVTKYQKVFTKVPYLLITVFALISFLWSCAYMSIYFKQKTWNAATLWMFNNVAPSSTILVEHWDYSLPHAMEKYSTGVYNYLQIKGYDAESLSKYEEMASNLYQGDFMVIASKRLTASIPREKDKYTLMTEYYKKLFNGDLGYVPVANFESYPTLGPLVFNDDSADESFQVYDHSPVKIFINTHKLGQNEILNKIYPMNNN